MSAACTHIMGRSLLEDCMLPWLCSLSCTPCQSLSPNNEALSQTPCPYFGQDYPAMPMVHPVSLHPQARLPRFQLNKNKNKKREQEEGLIHSQRGRSQHIHRVEGKGFSSTPEGHTPRIPIGDRERGSDTCEGQGPYRS